MQFLHLENRGLNLCIWKGIFTVRALEKENRLPEELAAVISVDCLKKKAECVFTVNAQEIITYSYLFKMTLYIVDSGSI